MDSLDWVRLAAGVAALVAAGVFALRKLSELVRLVRVAQPMPDRTSNLGAKLKYEITHVLGQQKLLRWTAPGVMHAFVFWGFIILQTQTLEAVGEVFDPDFHIPFFGPGTPQAEALGFLQDLFTVLVLIGVVGFVLIRFAQSPVRRGRGSRFAGSYLDQGWYVLMFEFGLLYSVMILRGTRFVEGTLPYEDGAFATRWLGQQLTGIDEAALHVIGTVALVAHVLIFSGFLVYTLNSKHRHVFSIVPQVLFSRLPKALGKLEAAPIDLEAMSEDDILGVGQIEQFGFKRFLDYYSCTECGRCQSQCPAWNTGKPLSPKLLIMDLRDHLWEKGPTCWTPRKPRRRTGTGTSTCWGACWSATSPATPTRSSTSTCCGRAPRAEPASRSAPSTSSTSTTSSTCAATRR